MTGVEAMAGRCASDFFFFNDTATTEIYTLSLHDALPICRHVLDQAQDGHAHLLEHLHALLGVDQRDVRSEEHTSELQSHLNLVCRLLLEKKKILKRVSAIDKDSQAESVSGDHTQCRAPAT